MKIVYVLSAATLASALGPQSHALTSSQSPIDSYEMDKLFDEQNLQISKLKARKDSADKAAKAALLQLEELEVLLEQDKKIQSKIGKSQNLTDSYISALVSEISTLKRSHAQLENEAASASRMYNRAVDRVMAQKNDYAAKIGASVPTQSQNLAGVKIPQTDAERLNTCRLDTEVQRIRLDPKTCQSRLSESFRGMTLAPNYTAPGRLIDRRGIVNQLSTSGNSTEASIKVSGNFRRSTVGATVAIDETNDREFRKSFSTWGYSLGLNSKNSGRIFSVSEKTNNRSIGSLDRLDSSVTLEGGLNFGVYPSETKKDFVARSGKMALNARKACLDDQKTPKPKKKSSCESDELVEWIFASGTGRDRSYLNPDFVSAFNDVYFGAKAKSPRWGGGVNLELGVPSFSFHRFARQSVSDPFDLDSTSTVKVVDIANLPQSFLNDKPEKSRKLAWSASLYGFFHFPARDTTKFNKGTTVILSGTHQREFKFPSGTEGVTICPQINTVAAAFSDELCNTVNIAAIERDQSFIAGIELRQKMRFNRFLPEIGFAPKYTRNFNSDRSGLDVPIYLTADKDGKLQGGIKLGHEWGGLDAQNNQRKSASEVSIFVGTTFSLSGND